MKKQSNDISCSSSLTTLGATAEMTASDRFRIPARECLKEVEDSIQAMKSAEKKPSDDVALHLE